MSLIITPLALLRKMRNAIRVFARPGKASIANGEFIIQTYKGFGSRREIFLMGRVFRQPKTRIQVSKDSLIDDLFALWRRMTRRGFGGAYLMIRADNFNSLVKTDHHGFFQIRLQWKQSIRKWAQWKTLHLQLAGRSNVDSPVKAHVYLPSEDARFVVISDIDDTVIQTGVTNKIEMLWRLFIQEVGSRTAFPGVAAFYQALHKGKSMAEFNPLLYVSRGPWTIYEILVEFFRLHRIPVGPILFLRYWGLTLRHPMPRRSWDHKYKMIKMMLEVYEDLPIILIGDSGQKDPEIYTRIVQTYPGRILAVYIRYVNRDHHRRRAIEKLAARVAAAGSRLLVANDSFVMAEHAAEQGFISRAALNNIMRRNRLCIGKK